MNIIKKNIYKSSELPDNTLEEFEEIRDICLILIEKLTEKYHVASVNAGLSKAQLELLLRADKKLVKKILINQAEYFLQAAEKVEE